MDTRPTARRLAVAPRMLLADVKLSRDAPEAQVSAAFGVWWDVAMGTSRPMAYLRAKKFPPGRSRIGFLLRPSVNAAGGAAVTQGDTMAKYLFTQESGGGSRE